MKSVLKIFLLATTIAFLGVACNSGSTEEADGDKQEQTSKQGKEYTSKYVCPMHCEGSGSDEPGQCPVCGMDYVLYEDYKEKLDSDSVNSMEGAKIDNHEHNHDHNHEH